MSTLATRDGMQVFYKDWGTGQPVLFPRPADRSQRRTITPRASSKVLRAVAVLLTIGTASLDAPASAQTAPAAKSSVLPAGGGKALLDTSDVAILLLDHQSGLFQTVKDISVTELRSNTVMLAKLATLLKIPVITTASEPGGPNGPLMPEIHQYAPHAVYVPRKGEVNAWDNEDFVKTVRAMGKRTLIMAGVWTSVCVMFPALDAKAAGFNGYRGELQSGRGPERAGDLSNHRGAGQRHRGCPVRRVRGRRPKDVPRHLHRALRHGDRIVLPYAVSDTFSNFATIRIAALLQALAG